MVSKYSFQYSPKSRAAGCFSVCAFVLTICTVFMANVHVAKADDSKSDAKVLNRFIAHSNAHSRTGRAVGGAPQEDDKQCVIEVEEVVRYPGKCTRVLGGRGVCQGEVYMDPMNAGCM